ncbi:MAG: hypothetical protein WCA28_13380 [Bradyrhizobium sp.]
MFINMKTGVGIVTTRRVIELIFKTSIEQERGRIGTFSPGCGVRLGRR